MTQQFPTKLSTKAACRVARMDRDRLNEHISDGRFACAPETVPGRARHFDPDDILALWYFRELMDDGLDAKNAGRMACEIARVAGEHPEERVICYVQTFFGARGTAMLPQDVPPVTDWDSEKGLVGFGHQTDIRKVTTFRVGKTRELIAHYTAEELSYRGEED